jgi:uncharacterized repeat protein (TIGR01451 family)/CSLREA domain-containing protein
MRRLACTILVCVLLGLPVQAPGLAAGAAQPVAAGATYHVNSTDDTPDKDVGAAACADDSGHCSLRAAIMQANHTPGADTIIVPAGTYRLTRSGNDDDAAQGDLDVTDDLTIQGAGSGSTSVDGNGGVTGDRVFQILSSAKDTSLSGLTIRAGQKISSTFDEGGGLLWEGTNNGSLRLSDVVFLNNSANYGGGLSLRYGPAVSVDLEKVVIRANRAMVGAGGGMVVDFGSGFGNFLLNNSQVYSNTAFQSGGMELFSPATQMAPLRIDHTDIYSNTVTGIAGGIEAAAGSAQFPLQIFNSHIDHNRAYQGGGMTIGRHVVLSQTTVASNTAVNQGGGLYANGGNVSADIAQSTLSGNTAQVGGGIYVEHSFLASIVFTLTNSTLSGNSASHDGGGLYANGGALQLFNDTVAANQVAAPQGDPYAGLGGGVYISPTAVITAVSTIIADNIHRYGASAPVPDDCQGTIIPKLFNLIETIAGCAFGVPRFGNITGQDPLLGPLQFNGGPTQTQALITGSLAIDPGGNHCSTPTGDVLTVDQRGFVRPYGAYCDIGAYEFAPEADLSVGQHDSPDPVLVKARLSYTVTITNNGPSLATGVVLTDTLPVSVSLRAAAATQGSCLGTITIICNLGSLASGTHITVTVAVTPTTGGLITNMVTVTANEFDPAVANNTASETTAAIHQLYLPIVRR